MFSGVRNRLKLELNKVIVSVPRLLLLLRIVNAIAAILVTRTILSYSDIYLVSVLIKAISISGGLMLLEFGIGNYLQVALANGTVSEASRHKVGYFLIATPSIAAVIASICLLAITRTTVSVSLCVVLIISSGAFGIATNTLNQLAFSNNYLIQGIYQQLVTTVLGWVVLLVAGFFAKVELFGVTIYYGIVTYVGIWNLLLVYRFLTTKSTYTNHGNQRDQSLVKTISWYSVEALIQPLLIAGMTFMISLESNPGLLRIYALQIRLINTFCAMFVVVYLSLWSHTTVNGLVKMLQQMRMRLVVGILGPIILSILLSVSHKQWVHFFLRGQSYKWGWLEGLTFLMILMSRTLLDLSSICAKIIQRQKYITVLSIFSLLCFLGSSIAFSSSIRRILFIYSTLLSLGAAFTYQIVERKFYAHRDI